MNKELSFRTEVTGNPCLDKCNGACCRNMMFPKISKEDTAKLIHQDTYSSEVPTVGELYDIFDEIYAKPQGVYYTELASDSNAAFLVGDCPNLQPDRSCGIYENRPEACRNFEAESTSCTRVRRREGLKSLSPEPNFISRAMIHLRKAS
jgi:Fe-S-cluster containining protein